jgi:hypothetical protein
VGIPVDLQTFASWLPLDSAVGLVQVAHWRESPMITTQPPRICGILAASVCLAVAWPSAAVAQTLNHQDPAHDVVKMSESSTDVVKVPANRSADITRVTFVHARRHLITRMKVRSYGGGWWTLTEVIKTPSARYLVWGTMWHGDLTFRIARDNGNEHSCAGLSGTIRPRREQVLVSIPTRCIRGPRWVRLGRWYTQIAKTGEFGYYDDALHKGLASSVALTPRLRRG